MARQARVECGTGRKPENKRGAGPIQAHRREDVQMGLGGGWERKSLVSGGLTRSGRTVTLGSSQQGMSGSGPERYQIINRHGAGWTGVSYLALDRESGRQVVLKPLPGACGMAGSTHTPPKGFPGFEHPNIVSIYDVLEESGVRYAVMENVSGTTLADLARGQGQQAPLVRKIAAGCLEALAAGAARGLAHGDIKPNNILIVEPPGGGMQVKLQDFGFGGMVDEKAMKIIVGDLHCLAPERFAGQAADTRTDLYSLGTCLYFALTGRVAFPEDDLAKVEASHRKPPVQPLVTLRPDVPAAFTAWVGRLMSANRDKRPPSARVALATLPAVAQAALPVAVPVVVPLAVPVPGGATRTGQMAARPVVACNPAAKPKRINRRRLQLGGMLLGGIIALGFGGNWLWQRYQAERASDRAHRQLQGVKKAGPAQPSAAPGSGSGKPPQEGDKSLPVQPPIILRGGTAVIHGKSQVRSLHAGPMPDQTLYQWFNPGEYPEWPITIARPGVFRVTLVYSLSGKPKAVGSTIEVLVDNRKLSVPLKGTGSWNRYVTMDLGDISIDRPGPRALAVKPVSKTGSAVMNLRSLTLTWREHE